MSRDLLTRSGHQSARPTLIFAHEGCFEVVGYSLPHADGLWVAVVHRLRAFVEAIIPEASTRRRRVGQSSLNADSVPIWPFLFKTPIHFSRFIAEAKRNYI